MLPDPDSRRETLTEILTGLQATPKTLPSYLQYSEEGSQLFDRVNLLPDFYPRDAELEIMDRSIGDIAGIIGENAYIAEYGSGSSLKTQHLLKHLKTPIAYVPIDISRIHMLEASKKIQRAFPGLEVIPLCKNFHRSLELPRSSSTPKRKMGYFPGTSSGNLTPSSLQDLMQRILTQVGPDGALLIGIDLHKDAQIINRAYNDIGGVSARFNLNALEVIRQSYDTNLEPKMFYRSAEYNSDLKRMEMKLVSRTHHSIRIVDQIVDFAESEPILLDFSYKYTFTGFERLARQAGWNTLRRWTDSNGYYSLNLCLSRESLGSPNG